MGSRIRWLVSVAMLSAAVWIAYWPSLRHLPRSDQLDYLVDTVEFRGFRDHYAHSFSYNRTRRIAPGDTLLFRPVLFLLLSAETVFLGTNFAAWQAIGILLHLAVVLLIFQLTTEFLGDGSGPPPETRDARLRREVFGLLPFLLALFFATSYAVQEMVIWTHIQGYLLFVLLVVASATLAWRSIRAGAADAPAIRDPQLVAAWTLALVATFLHEAGQVLALSLGALAYAYSTSRRAARAGLFLAVPVLYQVLNRVDAVLLHPVARNAGEGFDAVLARAFTAKTLLNSARFAKFTIVQPFFPSAVGTYLRDRLMIGVVPYADWRLSPLTLLSIALAIAWVGLTVRTALALARERAPRPRHPALAVAAVLILVGLGYAAANILGRMNLRTEPDQLVVNPYYVYFPLAVFVLASFALWTSARPGVSVAGSRLDAALAAVVAVGLASISLQSFPRVHDVNRVLSTSMAPGRERVRAIDRFIAGHESEPRFSLAFDMSRSSGVFGKLGVPITTMFYRKYEDNFQPMYVVSLSPVGLKALTLAQYQRQTGTPTGVQLFPDLTTVRADFNVFAFRGSFYAVPHTAPLFDPERPSESRAIRASSLAKALEAGDRAFTVKG